MKKTLSLILVCLFLLSLPACGMYSKQDLDDIWRDAYNEGYDDGLSAGEFRWTDYGRDEGYNEGHKDGQTEGYDDGYYDGRSDGYTEGYRDASNESMDMECAATDYACEQGGMHPEEAMCVVYDFENQTTLYNDTIPTVDDYITAVHSLYCFYEYYYSN